MVYLALLRGINVGGNNRVEMSRLRAVCESAGLTDVRTYINTGNVIFEDPQRSPEELTAVLQDGIAAEFGLNLKVLVRDLSEMTEVVRRLPDAWVNDSTMKCDVMFLWDEVDDPSTLKRLTIKQDIDDVLYVPGAIIWRVDKDRVTRSGLMRIAGTDLYRKMTIRNCNTVRKLLSLMEAMP